MGTPFSHYHDTNDNDDYNIDTEGITIHLFAFFEKKEEL